MDWLCCELGVLILSQFKNLMTHIGFSMKFASLLRFACLLFLVQAPIVLAEEAQEMRAKADQYYQNHDYKKAYKFYLRLAKTGDQFSQDRISQMYAGGKGTSVDLYEAYAWSVLAAEGGALDMVDRSSELLQRVEDEAKAEKKATKLQSQYGKKALREKAERKERSRLARASGNCTGSILGCS